MASPVPSLDEHLAARGPKRILALDGGGMRGLISLGFLERMERILRERHGNDPGFRLSHYFDLIAGTSSSAILAALLAQGHSVEEVIPRFQDLADMLFRRHWWDPLRRLLNHRTSGGRSRTVLGQLLGSAGGIDDHGVLRTGLLVMGQRLDSGAPWPISTIRDRSSSLSRSAEGGGAPADPNALQGLFIDSGICSHNNPALQAYGLAAWKPSGLRWPVGQDRVLIISVGTGRLAVSNHRGWSAARPRDRVLQRLIEEEGTLLVEGLMRGMGHGLTPPHSLTSELGDLPPHALVDTPRFSYARYDARLEPMPLGTSPGQLLALGRLAAQVEVTGDHFPAAFDLARLAAAEATTRVTTHAAIASPPSAQAPAAPRLAEEIRRYRQREGTKVLAIQLNLDMDSFTYRKWGGLQTCKRGDWIVDRNGSLHTVAADSFARTYQQVGPATYVKQGQVWAAAASCDGAIATKEGVTHYKQGDVLVWNDKELTDGYAIAKDVFASLYERIPPSAETS